MVYSWSDVLRFIQDTMGLVVGYEFHFTNKYRGADKSLARPGKKQAAPVKSVMGRGMD